MKTITIKIPEGLEAELRKLAESSGETTSGMVREALAEYVAKPHRQKKGNALDLVGSLAGSLEGPSDLATNPKHMKGFGK